MTMLLIVGCVVFAAFGATLIVAHLLPAQKKEKVVRIVRSASPTLEHVEQVLVMYGPLSMEDIRSVLIKDGFVSVTLPQVRGMLNELLAVRQTAISYLCGDTMLFSAIVMALQSEPVPVGINESVSIE